MLIINMSENGLSVEAIQAKLQQIHKQDENRAVILFNGRWYLYAKNSINHLQDYLNDYKKFISYSHSPCGFQYVSDIPSVKQCGKIYKQSQYLYSPHANCLYYYNHATKKINPIETNSGRPGISSEPKYVLNYFDELKRSLPITTLSCEELAYITNLTSHTQNEYFTLTPKQETCFNNRIKNEKVNSAIGWSSLFSGLVGGGIFGLLGGLVFASLIAAPLLPPVSIGLLFGLGALVTFLVVTQIIGRISAWATGEYKPITDIIHEPPQDGDSPRNTKDITIGLDSDSDKDRDLNSNLTVDSDNNLQTQVFQKTEKQKSLLKFEFNGKPPKKGSQDDTNISYYRKKNNSSM